MIIVGVDPGTGLNSALGVVKVNFDTLEIGFMREHWASDDKNATSRIRKISSALWGNWDEPVDAVASEYFVMRGKGGETLARMVGAVIATLPPMSKFIEVQNSTVKMIVGGHGAAPKEDVAEGVFAYFSANEESQDKIVDLIAEEKWDLLDALAIAITAYETTRPKK